MIHTSRKRYFQQALRFDMLPKEIGQVAQKGGFDGDLHISHTILEMASIDTCSDQNDDTHRVDCREQAWLLKKGYSEADVGGVWVPRSEEEFLARVGD
jgi:hypothetical protein